MTKSGRIVVQCRERRQTETDRSKERERTNEEYQREHEKACAHSWRPIERREVPGEQSRGHRTQRAHTTTQRENTEKTWKIVCRPQVCTSVCRCALVGVRQRTTAEVDMWV